MSRAPTFTSGTLADNGGPTGTIALLTGSVAIDAGVDASCPETDQRGPGYLRANGTPCDSGAFESDPGPDTVAPVFDHLDDITVAATDVIGAVVTYGPVTAMDDRDGTLLADCSPASGSQFLIGDTIVGCTATDAAGNTGSAEFTVTVTAAACPRWW